eukprot:TRINITY_DN7347_c0_g2_i1.p2 TRINITY_DN7347_c0_g2~~TRINITY_DN7347_c0_g2_i1.p2  ORF type:complete len:233 (-),score=28.78 TRINITY_DN7347_c0_g2_i1:247-945(-)
MFERFAFKLTFSEDSRGGGRASNVNLVPWMVQQGRYFVEHCGPEIVTQLKQAVNKICMDPISTDDADRGPRKQIPVPHSLALSLLIFSPVEWEQARRMSLMHALQFCVREYQRKKAAESEESSSSHQAIDITDIDDLFRMIHPMLCFYSMIDEFQKLLKPSRGERWVQVMNDRLIDVGHVLDGCKKILEKLEELESSKSIFEAFDIMELLSVVIISEGSSCEEFLQLACSHA